MSKETSLRGDPHAVLAAIDDFPDLPLVFQRNKLDLSWKILSDHKPVPRTLVELGGYIGYSAVAWGIYLKALNFGDLKDVKVLSVESDPKLAGIMKAIVELAGLNSVVEVVNELSCEALRGFKRKDENFSIDALFLNQ